MLVQQWEPRETEIGDACCDHFVDLVCQVDLQAGIERQDLEPAAQVSLALDVLAQPCACICHEHPPPLEVDGQQRRHAVGSASGENRDERSLVLKLRGVCLEVHVASIGRHAHHRRPWPNVELIDHAHRSGAEPRKLLADPLVSLREPKGFRPARHGA